MACVRVSGRVCTSPHANSDLKDPWNQLDFFIVLIGILGLMAASAGGQLEQLSALRALRAFRPLRAVKSAPQLRAVVNVFLHTAPVFINIVIISTFIYTVFAIGLMNLFTGRFWRCNDPSVTHAEDCYGTGNASTAFVDVAYYHNFDIDTEGTYISDQDYLWSTTSLKNPKYLTVVNNTFERKWYNAPRNFDTASSSFLTVMEMATLDHWVEILFLMMDSPMEPGFAPTEENRWYTFYLCLLVLVFTNFFFLNYL